MKIIAVAFLFLMLLFSCKKETGVPGPQGVQGNRGTNGVLKDTGSISGKLSLYDEFSLRKKDFSGITVTMTSGSLTLTDITDSAGEYHFTGLQTGTYNFSYQKTGFGTYKVFGVSHTPGGELPTLVQDVYLLQIPVKTAVDSISSSVSSPYVYIFVYLDTSSLNYVQYYQNFMLLVGKDANVSPSNYIQKYDAVYPDGNGAYSFPFSKDDLQAFFQTGDTLYITAGTYNRYISKLEDPNYLFDLGPNCYYVDPSNGNYVYPNMSISPNIAKVPF
ncbi:MAG TPA: carboxypeptidase-like regulatory domain-containing protein [Puia sp.]|nr:carboxypeptidase-like regulatory domain-containing protein [Puia sp.]